LVIMRFVALLFVSLMALPGCAGNLTNPWSLIPGWRKRGMVTKRPGDGRSQGYVIAADDSRRGYLRVVAQPGRPGTGQPQPTYFDIQAMRAKSRFTWTYHGASQFPRPTPGSFAIAWRRSPGTSESSETLGGRISIRRTGRHGVAERTGPGTARV